MRKQFNDFLEHLDEKPSDITKAKELAVKIISPKAKKESVFMPTTIIRSGILQNLNIKATTKQQHLSGLKLFEEYLRVRKLSLTSFDMFTSELVADFQKWLQTEHVNPKGRANTVWTINKQVRELKTLLSSYAVPKHISKTTVEDVFAIKPLKDKVDRRNNEIALRDDEIMQLYNYNPTTVQDEQIRDMFVLLCLTGQRISDITKLDLHIDNSLGFDTVSVVQQKTDTKVEFEFVFELARQILIEKYHGMIPLKDKLDRLIRNNIQRIAKEAGICGTITKQEQRGTDTATQTITMERWQGIKTHTARRTFISLLKVRGWDDTRIMMYSGHKDEKMVNYYCKLTSKDYKAFEHLKRNNPDKVLRFVEDYASNEAMPQPASKPLDLGKEIEIGKSIYVWVHRSERLTKEAEMYNRFYMLDCVDEEQGEYQLLRFIKDDCR